MTVQNPLKQSIKYVDGDYILEEMSDLDILEKHHHSAFLCYQWGVWCTAWARLRLEEMIRLCEEQGTFVYTDTDSCKYMGNVDFSEYNETRIKDSLASGAYASDPSGTVHFMGVAEYEGEYAKFRTLGAKKYVSQDSAGHLHCTVAGVDKAKGGPELERAGGIDAFTSGFVFVDAGGTELIYNDNPPMDSIEIEGHTLPIIRNVVIKPSTYKLGLAADYERLLRSVRLFDS